MNRIKKFILSVIDKICYNQDYDDIDVVTETSCRLAGLRKGTEK